MNWIVSLKHVVVNRAVVSSNYVRDLDQENVEWRHFAAVVVTTVNTWTLQTITSNIAIALMCHWDANEMVWRKAKYSCGTRKYSGECSKYSSPIQKSLLGQDITLGNFTNHHYIALRLLPGVQFLIFFLGILSLCGFFFGASLRKKCTQNSGSPLEENNLGNCYYSSWNLPQSDGKLLGEAHSLC